MLGSSSNHPSRPPPTLHTLPTEIISHVVSWLDRNSAITLARTAGRFTLPSEERIWRDLDLFLPPRFGDVPYIIPRDVSKRGHQGVEQWREEEAERAKARHRAGLKEKTRLILLRADERRVGLVTKATVVPRATAANSQCQVLDLVSANLQSLALHDPEYLHGMDQSAPLDTLDFHIINSRISFPSLTSIHIHPGAISSIMLLSHLCLIAPNLVSLDAPVAVRGVADDSPLAVPTLNRDTAIERLHITDGAGVEDVEEYQAETLHALEIIRHSPQLRLLSLDIADYTGEQQKVLANILADLQHLQSLRFATDMPDLHGTFGDKVISTCVHTLLLDYWQWWHMFLYLPNCPSVETLLLGGWHGEIPVPPAPMLFPEPSSTLAMIPSFADGIRRCASLHTTYVVPRSGRARDSSFGVFSRVSAAQESGTIAVSIRSFKNSGAELLHARLLVQRREISDEVYQTQTRLPPRHPTFLYTARDGSRRRKVFEKLPEAVWTDYTDFEGLKVPLEIIGQMRRVEGVSERQWVGRGIEVSQAAWKVLTDWRDEMLAAQ